jgi:hypothetical protein
MTMPRVGDAVSFKDYGGQTYLYHVAPRAALASIRTQGLVPGRGQSMTYESIKEHCQGRVFFTTQPEKWQSYFGHLDVVLLRVDMQKVRCFYDGGEWDYDGDEPEDEIIDGRLADCFGTHGVPPEQLQVLLDGQWRPLRNTGGKRRHASGLRLGSLVRDVRRMARR